jgi:hypothetical protein
MWFPDNKPLPGHAVCRNRQLNNTTTAPRATPVQDVVTTRFPGRPRARTGARVTAVIAWGKRPVPSRTRKLRPTAPMVLHPGGCGRVGHRRTLFMKNRGREPQPHGWGSPAFNPQTSPSHGPPPAARDMRSATPNAGEHAGASHPTGRTMRERPLLAKFDLESC